MALKPLNTFTPQDKKARDYFEKCLQAAMNAADPGEILHNQFYLFPEEIVIFGETFPIQQTQPIYLISIGKASLRMASVLVEKCGQRIARGICVTKDLDPNLHFPPAIQVIQSSHPAPNEQSLQAANLIEQLISESPPDAFVLCAISGGGSSLVVQPAEGITLTDYQHLSRILLSHDYSITEINTIRKHIDLFKGGGMLRWMEKRKGLALILSDVISNDLSVIASGPTVPDSSTYRDALEILQRKGDQSQIPASILSRLNLGAAGKIPETLKPEEYGSEKWKNIIIGSLEHSMNATCEEARQHGLVARKMEPPFTVPIKEVAERILADIQQYRKQNETMMLIYGGEGTLEINGKGRGGRNSHLAWLLAQKIKEIPGVTIMTFATDGDDGNSKAAGAILDSKTCVRAEQKSMDVQYYGDHADTATFFELLNDRVVTGITGTNVNDLVFVLLEKME